MRAGRYPLALILIGGFIPQKDYHILRSLNKAMNSNLIFLKKKYLSYHLVLVRFGDDSQTNPQGGVSRENK